MYVLYFMKIINYYHLTNHVIINCNSKTIYNTNITVVDIIIIIYTRNMYVCNLHVYLLTVAYLRGGFRGIGHRRKKNINF